MVNLAVAAEEVVRVANGAPDLLRVVATADVGDAVAPALLQSFARRATSVEATLGIATTEEMRALAVGAARRRGARPGARRPGAPGVVAEPLLRYRLLFVAANEHRLRNGPAAVVAAPARRGVAGRSDGDRSRGPALGGLLARIGVPEANVRVFPTQSLAWAAAAGGSGIAPAIEQLWSRDPHPGVGPLPVAGTPIETLWHVSMLHGDRRPPSPAGCTASWRRPTPPRR